MSKGYDWGGEGTAEDTKGAFEGKTVRYRAFCGSRF